MEIILLSNTKLTSRREQVSGRKGVQEKDFYHLEKLPHFSTLYCLGLAGTYSVAVKKVVFYLYDFCKLNSQTVEDAFVLPGMDERLYKSRFAKHITCVDLAATLWQTPIRHLLLANCVFFARKGWLLRFLPLQLHLEVR